MSTQKHKIEAARKEVHVLSRLRERYGLSVTHDQLGRIRQRILDGDGVHLCRQGDSVSVVELPFGKRRIVLVFDAERGTFRTALPGRGDRTVEEYLQHLRQFYSW